jgi:SAM-dependent methyltransferase
MRLCECKRLGLLVHPYTPTTTPVELILSPNSAMAEEPLVHTKLGAGVYTKSSVPLLYQKVVLGFNFPYVWKCPVDVLWPFFRDNFSKKHLDCGVANGYFCGEALTDPATSNEDQHVTLLDLSQASLDSAKQLLVSKSPGTDINTVLADIRGPVPAALEGVKFDSISMYNLFHCVPGGSSKFRQGLLLGAQLLSPDGVLYGCTILGHNNIHSILSWLTMVLYNWIGIFSNWDDTEDDVIAALHNQFNEVETRVVGQVLLFKARSIK